MSKPLTIGHASPLTPLPPLSERGYLSSTPVFTPPRPVGPLTTIALEAPAPKESARLDPVLVAESDFALRYGHLSARTDQLVSVVDEVLLNLAEIQFDAPKLAARLLAARDAAKAACGVIA